MAGSSEETPAATKPESSPLFGPPSAQVRLPTIPHPTGNAFSQQREKRRSAAREAAAIPLVDPALPGKPKIVTRTSTLDLSAQLALPMPKVRPPDSMHPAFRNDVNVDTPPEGKAKDLKCSRSFTDPSNGQAARHMSAMPKPLFAEKKSKMAMLKSKFSIDNMKGKIKRGLDKETSTPPIASASNTSFDELQVFKPRDSGEVSSRLPPIIAEDEPKSPTLVNEARETPVTPQKPPKLESINLVVEKTADNPQGRFYKQYEQFVGGGYKYTPADEGLGSPGSSGRVPDNEHTEEGIIVGEAVTTPDDMYEANDHGGYMTQKPSMATMRPDGGFSNPEMFNDIQENTGAQRSHSRQFSGESVYESAFSAHSSVDRSELRAWEHMRAAHPDTMPEFASVYVPTPTNTVRRVEGTTTQPGPVANKTSAAPTWPFIVSSTPPKQKANATDAASTSVSAPVHNAPVAGPVVSQAMIHKTPSMAPIHVNDNQFRQPSQGSSQLAAPAKVGKHGNGPPPPVPTFPALPPLINAVGQNLHHHLDDQSRYIGNHITSSRDYMLDQVLRRLSIIEDDVGGLRQHVLLQNAQVEEVRAQMVRLSHEVVRLTEGVQNTENKLVEKISELKGFAGLPSEGTAGPRARCPSDKETQQKGNAEEVVVSTPKQEKTEVDASNTAINKSSQANTTTPNAAEKRMSVLENIPTPTAAYRTPSTKGKDDESESGSVLQLGGLKDEDDVFVDKIERSENVRGFSNALETNGSANDSATLMSAVSEKSSENNDTKASTNGSGTTGDGRNGNTQRRRNYWPKGFKTPTSRGGGPNTGPARMQQASMNFPKTPPPMSRKSSNISQASVHPGFRNNTNSMPTTTPHRDHERDHARNWFQSANRSRPGSYVGQGPASRPPSRPQTPFRGDNQNRAAAQNYNYGNRNNANSSYPPSGRGGNWNRRGSASNHPAVRGSNPYDPDLPPPHLRPEYMFDPTWVPGTVPYDSPPYTQRFGPPLPPIPPRYGGNQPFGGVDGNASSGGSVDQGEGENEVDGEHRAFSWGSSSWYDKAYGASGSG
ncbi:hypothetical protein FQN54_007924 [Arachnomyces sp. PD_36]|nr:hypothetical protein FQN54_007924 [Arachnomyces sp. PD_36]